MKKQELYQLFLENHNNSLENLNKSLKNQIEYQIVNHQRIDNLNDLKAELCGGTSTPELEIRFDAGHQPWVSHSARIGRLGLINHLYSEELQDKKLSLEESLKLFKEYLDDNPNHRLVLDIKELGANVTEGKMDLENVKDLLVKYDLKRCVIFSVSSPCILGMIHFAFPSSSIILKGGIIPVISANLAQLARPQYERVSEQRIAFLDSELYISDSSMVK